MPTFSMMIHVHCISNTDLLVLQWNTETTEQTPQCTNLRQFYRCPKIEFKLRVNIISFPVSLKLTSVNLPLSTVY